MIFAKPRDGFEWAESKKAKSQLRDILKDHPELKPYWNALKERLIHTGHREGTKAPFMDDSNAFIFSTELENEIIMQVLYTILGFTLTAQSVRLKEPIK